MNKKKILNILLMALATLLWGTSFAAQTTSTQYIGPLTIMALRSYVGAAALGCVALIRAIANKKSSRNAAKIVRVDKRKLITAGVICGIALAVASGLQQSGIYYNSEILHQDSAGKAGFLTALYIILVPLSGLFLKRKTSPSVIAGALFGTVGMYFLCVSGVSGFSLGDLMLLGCAIAYTVHIIVIDQMGFDCDPIKMSFIQFLTCAILLTVVSLLTEGGIETDFVKALPSIIYLGVMSSAVAFTIQIYVQKTLHPAVASLVMSFESVVAAISGAVFLNETMTAMQIFACALMFSGILIAQFGSGIKDILRKHHGGNKGIKK